MSRLEPPAAIRRLTVTLIKPSKYDDDGYVIRYWRGVLPSNTLACLYGLTDDVRERGVLGRSLAWRIEAIDETVQRVDVARIIRTSRQPGTKAIVCLVGVQSNQFARAADLARTLREGGVTVLIGGFHVSGSLAMLPDIPAEIRQLLEVGVCVVAGEIEGRWESILRDALEGRLKPVYNFLLQPPALDDAPMPRIPPGYLRRFVAPNFATLDCSRGCPFSCSFCTVINVQGRAMRVRDPERIIDWVRQQYRRGVSAYFFTDDNFCRNPHWAAILDGLIRLRREEGAQIAFMVQVDTQSHKLPGFVDKAGAAGCVQVFIGLESLNPRNLEAAGKRQNRVGEFRALVEVYRRAGINTHMAYIIGFPFDDEESVPEDMRQLMQELGPEQASFFMLTPLPGSRDHLELLRRGAPLDPDLNRYDSFHATTDHPRMSRQAWCRAYDDAWMSFYSPGNMKAILRRVDARNYWAVFANFVWYKHSALVERGHPMIHGFVRLKGRRQRRDSLPREGRWAYLRRRLRDVARYARLWPAMALEMEEVWLQTRPRSPVERRVVEELRGVPSSVRGWRRMRLSEIQAAYRRAAAVVQQTGVRMRAGVGRPVPPKVWLWLQRHSPFAQSLTWSRGSLTRFWRRCLLTLRRGRLDRVDVTGVAFNLLQEGALFAAFTSLFFSRLLARLLSRRGVRGDCSP